MKTVNYFFKGIITFTLICFTIQTNAENSFSGCAQDDLTLQFNFDNNHDDIHWVIYDSNYNPITGGGPFTNQSQNASITINLPSNYFLRGNGNYNLVVYDETGNGFGNGSYTLSENNNILAQNSSFTYSQATTFCHGSGTFSQLDVTSPTDPLNARIKSTTNNSITLEWDASTDTESPLAYQIIIDNSPYASSTLMTEYTFPAISGASYDVKIFAYDRMGNLCVQPALITVSINSSNICSNGNLSLDLSFGMYPNEVAWQIKDANNAVVDNSNYQGDFYYANASPNSALTESINALAPGDYILVIYDANGNGGTTYSLSDTNNTIISGTTTGYSDVIQFCVGNTSTLLDTVSPSDPLNLTIDNITPDNRLELSWDASTDNEAVTEYGIFLFNSSISSYLHYPIGDSNTNSHTTIPLPPGVNSITVVARDEAGNFSNRSNNLIFSVTSRTTIHEGFFETGWDGWTDGGANAARPSNNNAYEGDRSARLRNGTSTSKITLSNQQLSGFTAIEFSFYFIARGLENNESFILEYFDGSVWTTVNTLTKSIDFSNNQFYNVVSTLSNNDYSFNNNSAFRITMQGNQNNDRVFIDQTKVVGINGGLHTSSNTVQPVPQINRISNTFEKKEDKSADQIPKTDELVQLYPNPSKEYFSLKNNSFPGGIVISNSQGKIIKSFVSQKEKYYINDLPDGIYYVKFNDSKRQKPLRLIKN